MAASVDTADNKQLVLVKCNNNEIKDPLVIGKFLHTIAKNLGEIIFTSTPKGDEKPISKLFPILWT